VPQNQLLATRVEYHDAQLEDLVNEVAYLREQVERLLDDLGQFSLRVAPKRHTDRVPAPDDQFAADVAWTLSGIGRRP
jgi:hypothetical protein